MNDIFLFYYHHEAQIHIETWLSNLYRYIFSGNCNTLKMHKISSSWHLFDIQMDICMHYGIKFTTYFPQSFFKYVIEPSSNDVVECKKRRYNNFHIFSSFVELFEKVTFSNHIHLFDLQCMKKWILNKPFPEGYLHKRADKLLSIRYKILLTFSHGLQFSEKRDSVDKKKLFGTTNNEALDTRDS